MIYKEKFGKVVEAYEQMATVARYRPAAPGDGFGSVFLTPDQVRDKRLLRQEAIKYAGHFGREEDTHGFLLGVSDIRTVRAFVYTVEAARSLCGWENELAAKLMRMAARELRTVCTSKR